MPRVLPEYIAVEELIIIRDFVLSFDLMLDGKQMHFQQINGEWYSRHTGTEISTEELFDNIKERIYDLIDSK